MKPIEFKEQNIVYAKDQPEYIPLPGHKVADERGEFIFCMGIIIHGTGPAAVHWEAVVLTADIQ